MEAAGIAVGSGSPWSRGAPRAPCPAGGPGAEYLPTQPLEYPCGRRALRRESASLGLLSAQSPALNSNPREGLNSAQEIAPYHNLRPRAARSPALGFLRCSTPAARTRCWPRFQHVPLHHHDARVLPRQERCTIPAYERCTSPAYDTRRHGSCHGAYPHARATPYRCMIRKRRALHTATFLHSDGPPRTIPAYDAHTRRHGSLLSLHLSARARDDIQMHY